MSDPVFKNEGEFEKWAKDIRAKLMRHAFGVLRNFHDAENITQETLAAVWFHRDDFHGIGHNSHGKAHFNTWVYKVHSNACNSAIRKRKSRREHVTLSIDEIKNIFQGTEGMPRQLVDEPKVEVDASHKNYAAKLLNRISEKERRLILLQNVDGYSVEEISQMTGLRENTLKVQLFRTRQKIIKDAQKMDRMAALKAAIDAFLSFASTKPEADKTDAAFLCGPGRPNESASIGPVLKAPAA